jgi:hypothetical protein
VQAVNSALDIDVSGYHQAVAALPSDNKYVGDSAGPAAGLVEAVKTKDSFPCRDTKPGRQARIQPLSWLI